MLIKYCLILILFVYLNVIPEPFLYDWVDHLQKIMKERKQEIINEKNLIMPCEGKQKQNKYYIIKNIT